MLGCILLVDFEQLFRSKCSRHNLLFGGINVIFIGDPAQLLPIGDKPLYTVDQQNTKAIEGRDIYNSIATANTVILETNRRTSDLRYSQFQENIRNGRFTNEMISTLNSLNNTAPINESASYVPIIATSNATVKALYESKTRVVAQQLISNNSEAPILLLADIQSAIPRKQRDEESSCPFESTHKKIRRKRKKPAPLTESEVRYLDLLPDKIFDNFPMAFFLYIGASGMISTNIGVDYQLANGTRGEIVGWQFPENTTFHNSVYHGVKVRIPMLNAVPVPVDLVYFKVTSYPLTVKPPGQPHGLGPNVVCIPRRKHTVNKSVSLPRSAVISNRLSVGIEITQIPIRTADVLTEYNSQGSQYDQYVIWDIQPKSFYQVISRGKNGLKSINLKQKITREFADKVIARTAFNEEIERLKQFHDETKTRLQM